MGLTSVESKRKTAKLPIVKGDKRRDTQEYWEERLKRMGLTPDAGQFIGSKRLSYGHEVSDLDFDGRNTFRPTTGERLDEYQEWPLSMC